MKSKLTAKQILFSLIKKKTGAHALIDYSKEYIESLSDQDATFLLEFLEKTYLCRRDKEGDLLPIRTDKELKADTKTNNAARADILNSTKLDPLEK